MIKIKHFLLFLSILGSIHLSLAKIYIRYNPAGYFPETKKRIIIMSDENCSGMEWTIENKSGKQVLSGTIQKSTTGKSGFTPKPYNYIIDFTDISAIATYTFLIQSKKYTDLVITSNPYEKILPELIRFIKVHRSGTDDILDRKPAHFGDSSCYVFRRKNGMNTAWEEDSDGKKVTMKGGWYDGFEFTKYTLTNAHVTYFLLRSYEMNPGLFKKKYSKTDFVDILDEAKFGLDYLAGTMPDNNEFIIEVGGFADNENGIKLPHKDSRDGKREAYSALSQPQMGSTAAALALGSAIFSKQGKSDAAKLYKKMALKIFNAAVSSEIQEPAWIKKDYDLYMDTTPFDNLLLAGVELYRITKDPSILEKSIKFALKAKNSGWVSYADLHLFAHLRFMETFPQSKEFLLSDLNEFYTFSLKSDNIWRQPIEYTYNSLYPFMETASVSLLYENQTSDNKFNDMALSMVDYAFGLNNWGYSFVSSQSIKQSVKNYYSQIYMLQTHLFPTGAIATGPIDTRSHKAESIWCYYDQNARPEKEFNTSAVRFFDHSDDFMCMSSHTYGVADGIFLLTLMSTMYGK